MKILGARTIVTEVDYHEIEKVISEYFHTHHGFKSYAEGGGDKQNFELPDIEECSNGTSLKFSIDGIVDDYWLKQVNEAIENKNFYKCNSTRVYLNYLCSKGVIEPADYLIRVSW